MDRDHRVFIVERNSITNSNIANKVRVQCIEGSGFWPSGNQVSRNGKPKRGGGIF
jgi:hypothetical protein